jgi:hypothetical protein
MKNWVLRKIRIKRMRKRYLVHCARVAFRATLLSSVVLVSQLKATPSDSLRVDILKSFQVGREWTYSYDWDEYDKEFPLVRFGSDVFSVNFTGSLTVTVVDAKQNSQTQLTTFYLNRRTKGVETRKNKNGDETARIPIDSSSTVELREDSSAEPSSQATRGIRGWLFPDTLRAPKHCGPNRRFYPLGRFYRYYKFPLDTLFQLSGDTIKTTANFGDCFDSPSEATYAIVPDSGIVYYNSAAAAWVPFGGFAYGYGMLLRSLGSRIVDAVEEKSIQPRVGLHQNYPNPFNPSTTISYEVQIRSTVTLKVYNLLGQEVATLVNEMQDSGFRSVVLNAKGLPSGVYFCRLQAGRFVETKKLILLR